jgi:predicted amidohydrolase
LTSPDVIVGRYSVPFLAKIDELNVLPIDDADAWYSISLKEGVNGDRSAPKDWTNHWHERSRQALANLDSSGAHVGVLPELSLTDGLLTHWQHLLRHTARPRRSKLQWILVGTGLLSDGHENRRPRPNRAALLHRRTGAIILQQDKCEGFSMSDTQMRLWQLHTLRPGPRAEWMREGRHRYVLDTWAGRFSIVICEDLNQLMTVGADLATLSPTHLLIPIFAAPIIRHRWQQGSAVHFANTVGSASVVVNSRAVVPLPSDKEQIKAEDTGTAIVVQPTGRGPSTDWSVKVDIQDIRDPARVATFVLPRK